MKLCSQCGYCNGDYMNNCARCSASLSPQSMSQNPSVPGQGGSPLTGAGTPNAPKGFSPAGQGPVLSAPPQPQLTQPQAYPQISQPGMAPGIQYPSQQPGLYPYAPQTPGVQPFPAMYNPQQRPGIQPPYPPRPQYGPYPYATQPQRPNPNINPPEEYTDLVGNEDQNGETPFPLKPPKRSSLGAVTLILILLLGLSGGVIYYFYANELFPIEVSDKIGGVIDSVTGFFGISNEDDSEESTAYNTMLSRVRNDMQMNDEQAKAVVSILLFQCSVTDILGISPAADLHSYNLNTPEGRCLVIIDPQTQMLKQITTIEHAPRVIYENGGALSSVAALCVNDEEIALLKKHAEDRMKSYLPIENVDKFIFASDEHWNFHKDKGWVAVSSYTSPNTEGGYNERIPFYFEYEYTNTDNNPSYTFKYAKINDNILGDPHFPDPVNPYEDGTTGGGDVDLPSSTEDGTGTQDTPDAP